MDHSVQPLLGLRLVLRSLRHYLVLDHVRLILVVPVCTYSGWKPSILLINLIWVAFGTCDLASSDWPTPSCNTMLFDLQRIGNEGRALHRSLIVPNIGHWGELVVLGYRQWVVLLAESLLLQKLNWRHYFVTTGWLSFIYGYLNCARDLLVSLQIVTAWPRLHSGCFYC